MKLLTSPKTSIAGALSGLAVILDQIATIFDADPLTNPDFVIIAGAIGMIYAFLNTRDNDKTSKQIGLK